MIQSLEPKTAVTVVGIQVNFLTTDKVWARHEKLLESKTVSLISAIFTPHELPDLAPTAVCIN